MAGRGVLDDRPAGHLAAADFFGNCRELAAWVQTNDQLFRDLKFDGVPVFFNWPTQGGCWRYPAAEDVVDASAGQLEQFLQRMFNTNQTQLRAVNISAHSPGNSYLMDALKGLALQRGVSSRTLYGCAQEVRVTLPGAPKLPHGHFLAIN
jgi:esterase/lipase superfamily enzyme